MSKIAFDRQMWSNYKHNEPDNFVTLYEGPKPGVGAVKGFYHIHGERFRGKISIRTEVLLSDDGENWRRATAPFWGDEFQALGYHVDSSPIDILGEDARYIRVGVRVGHHNTSTDSFVRMDRVSGHIVLLPETA